MSEFKIYCRCGQHILLDETYIGEVIECPNCHEALVIPKREMQPIDVGEAVLKGVDLYKSNFGLVLGAVLLSFLVGGFTLGICYGPMFVGLFALLARLAKKPDPKPGFGDVGDIFNGLNRFLPSFMLMLVTGVAVLATVALFFVLFIVTMRVCQFLLAPLGVILMIPFVGLWLVLALLVILALGPVQMWSLMLLANTDMTWQEAVAFVVKSTFGKKAIRPITLGVVATFVGGVGVLFCGLGSALTLPLMFCIYAAAYEQAFGKAPEKPALPGAVA